LRRDNDGKVVPISADASDIDWFISELILVIMVIYGAMVCGPVAAFLVELFPAKIRYTSLSLPYHIGADFFGGMLPLLATAVVASTGNIYNGLWYPIVVAAMIFAVGAFFYRDERRRHCSSRMDNESCGGSEIAGISGLSDNGKTCDRRAADPR
jgi:hypothetical protein